MNTNLVKKLFYPAIGLVYVSNGMHLVIIGWLAAHVLAVSPVWVALFMAVMLLPQIVLLPFTGKWADAYAPEKLAMWGCLGLAFTHLVFAVSNLGGVLTNGALGVYAFTIGLSMALFLPAKEKVSVLLRPHRLQKTLALSGAFQYAGLFVGALLAGLLAYVGLTSLLLFQCFLTLASACYWRMLKTPKAVLRVASVRSVKDMLRESPGLQQLILVCAFCGFMHMGFALALFPVLGVTHWGFDGSAYALMQSLFSAGGIVVYLANAYRKPHQYPGQALLFCLLYTAAIAYCISRGPTVAGSYGLIFLWGVVAGYSASMSRVLLHSLVVDHERGQASALYQSVLLIAAPIGSLVCGLILQLTSLMTVLWLISAASVVVFVLFLFTRQLWSVKQDGVT